ncbi:MAG: protein-L-isoaspartate(D-aspartate) O-methyltransferase [Chloroflexota bacterium]|nr:protein-L-isoaspartate(D-aspartate) O-methyltransferase [Chloroflexota bacterium]
MTFAQQRAWMVENQLKGSGIRDPRVLDAMASVPRELFVPERQRDMAYYDGALPIGEGQTISQPFVVAHMTEALSLAGEEKVLEIGTGSGYQTAIFSHLVKSVYTIERVGPLADHARAILESLGITNVFYLTGDGSQGWPEHAAYDAILVGCAAAAIPPPLLDQLAEGGRLIMPIGPRGFQDLVLASREGDEIREQRLSPVAFVPLVGKYGWSQKG